jgi:hypothetical protein
MVKATVIFFFCSSFLILKWEIWMPQGSQLW